MLKIRRKKKMARDQEIQQQNIQAQSQANIQAQQAAAESEMQKQQSIAQTSMALEQSKNDLDIQKLHQEAAIKKELMALEFQYNMQLKDMEVGGKKHAEKNKEDRKDERTKIQATQQSELIEQRNGNLPPKNFESANDNLGGVGDMSSFGPR